MARRRRRLWRNKRQRGGAVGAGVELFGVTTGGFTEPWRPVGLHRRDYERGRDCVGGNVRAVQQVEDRHRAAVGTANRLLVTNVDLAEAKMSKRLAAGPRVRADSFFAGELCR